MADKLPNPVKTAKTCPGSLSRLLLRIISAAFVSISLVSRASTATWLDNPVNGDWNNPVNWTTGGPPNGPADMASFAASNQTAILLSTNTEVDSVVFDNGATSYTITTGPSLILTISGAGVLRTSNYLSTFVTETTDGNSPDRGQLWFTGSASAGTYTFIVNNGSGSSSLSGGRAVFFDNSTAGTAIITQNGPSETGGDGGRALFLNNASAGNASITNLGGVPVSGPGGERGQGGASFNNSSTAGDALIYNYGGNSAGAAGGVTQFLDSSSASDSSLQSFGSTKSGSSGGRIDFFDNSTADSAYLLARGGSGGGGGGAIYFRGNSAGATSRVELRGNGFLDISDHDAPGVSIGSLEGQGNVFLGAKNLSVGGNAVGFEGVIQDGGEAGGAGGSLTKIGAETLFLYNTNTYSGGTVVNGGALYAVHDHALGSGNVTAVMPGTTLAFQPSEIGASNDYIADTATLSIVSSATINLIYDGTDTIGVLILDGMVQPPGLYGANLAPSTSSLFHSGGYKSAFIGNGRILAQLPVAVSRKEHGGSFYDIYLPLTGPSGIECRSGGGANSYQVVVRFLNNTTFTSAVVTSGNAMVSNVSGNGTTQATINLSGVANQQTVNITLFSLNDGLGVRDLVIPMAVLFGDTTGNGMVNSSDVSETKNHVGEPVSATNFRDDIIVNGEIDSFDVENVKSHSGTGLPMALPSPQISPPRSGHRLPLLP